jgi:hypothetical protein
VHPRPGARGEIVGLRRRVGDGRQSRCKVGLHGRAAAVPPAWRGHTRRSEYGEATVGSRR